MTAPTPLMAPPPGAACTRAAPVQLSPVEAMGWAQLLRAAADAPASTRRLRRAARRSRRVLRLSRFVSRIYDRSEVHVGATQGSRVLWVFDASCRQAGPTTVSLRQTQAASQLLAMMLLGHRAPRR